MIARIATADALTDSMNDRHPTTKHPAAVAVFLALFGLYLFVGAGITFSRGHWPAFMPPLLDAIALPLTFISDRLGATFGALAALAFGVLCLAISFRLAKTAAG